MSERRWGRTLNWRAAAGEVVLIVLGILIAMAASDWQNRRAARQTELAALRELHTALSEDLATLEAALSRYEDLDASVTSLLSHLRSGAPYSDSLDARFGSVYGFRSLDLNRAGYESLKSRGLDLISEDSLRSRIAGVYERAYPRVQGAAQLEEDVVLGLLRPYFLAHFTELRFGSSATPVDYRALVIDAAFLNLVDYRLQTIRQNHIPRIEHATTEIRALLASISAELERS